MPYSSDAWTQTYTGKQFHFLRPRAEEVCIEDVAHALSHQCRFAGHVQRYFSVAQHSVMVSRMCKEQPLWGLLHDASEAYLCDLPAPLKHCGVMWRYLDVEEIVMHVVLEHFDLPRDKPDEVYIADRIALATEVRDLMAHPEITRCVGDWPMEDRLPPPLEEEIVPLSPTEAELEFLYRYREVTSVKA